MIVSDLKKSRELARELLDLIQLRLPDFTVSQSLEDESVDLTVSESATPTAGEDNIFIRIQPEDTDFNNSVGLGQEIYSPHVFHVVEEESTVTDLSAVKMETKAKIEAELWRMGVKQKRYLRANGTAPSGSDVDPANLKATVAPDLIWPLSGQ